MARNCGECLFNTVDIVELGKDGKCPKCGADYGPEPKQPKPKKETKK